MFIIKNFRKLIHPLLLSFVKCKKEHKFVFLNEMPNTQKTAIYVFNHGTKYDVPYVAMIIKRHIWFLGGKQRLTLIDRFFCVFNGTVWIDRKSRESKSKGNAKMLKLLRKGNNLCIFPEGTWNIVPSLPMLPLNWGVIHLSSQTDCPIVPIVMEYDGDRCYVNFGKPMYCNDNDDKSQRINELRDEMATLRWAIWEKHFISKRLDVKTDEWQKEIDKRLKAYPLLDFEYEESCIRKIR